MTSLINRNVLRLRISLKTMMLILFSFWSNMSFSQVNTDDSIALVALYNTTNGTNWYHNDNWLSGPVNTWWGITILGSYVHIITLESNNLNGYLSDGFTNVDSVRELNISNNHLTGVIPSTINEMTKLNGLLLSGNHFISPIPESIATLYSLINFRISNNDFTGAFPDTLFKKPPFFGTYVIDSNEFSSLPYYSNFHALILCDNNKLNFTDILPYTTAPPAGSLLITYAPQDSIGIPYDTVVTVGDSIKLSAWTGGAGNQYMWKKGFMYITLWDTASTLTLNNIQLNQSGYYSCDIKNAGAPLLTLCRKLIHVQVNLPDAVPTIPDKPDPMLSFNPENQFLRIQLNFPSRTDVRSYLYDMMGRKVMTLYEDKTTYQDLHYYLNWLKPGIYLVNLQYNGEQHSTKILIR